MVPLAIGETYHIYNRGAHKRDVFTSERDYQRFQLLLHLMNGTSPIEMRNVFRKYGGRSSAAIFEEEVPEQPLVDVLAYCLMPNHFHLVLRQKVENGISVYLKKVFTAYSMYFNTKYEHSGVLFQGRFKSRHIDNEAYFRYIFAYVHLNPLSILQPDWETKGFADSGAARLFLGEYSYSSYVDYSVGNRAERALLAHDDIPEFLMTQNDFEQLFHCVSQDITEDRPPQTR